VPRRRLLILVVLLAALTGLAASVAPRKASDAPGPPPPVTATANPGEPRLGPRDAPAHDVAEVTDIPSEPPLRQLDAGGTRQVVEVEAGQRARLSVSGDDLVSVQIGVDGPIESVDPDSPARFDLLYTTPMRLAIRRLDTGRLIGELRVIPADG
jgi:hypothetical protein